MNMRNSVSDSITRNHKPMLMVIFSVAVLFSTRCFGQSYSDYTVKQDSAIDSCIAKLEKNGIDTICIYRQYCVGCIIAMNPFDKTCNRQPFENTTYFFWKRGNMTYFTAKDYCFNYDTVQISDNQLWHTYTVKRPGLKNEEAVSKVGQLLYF